ncbi:glycosyltransferase family 9 protein [Paraburkholderia lycopersici]|uniref:Glycosyltransferase family 9 (Heptosyltransferase) n=1 Tax=Paraburkholderia lycopersici TaxID=416944 RepID=A0A1G6NIS0_9BURK|nr:ADP-heptose--LPS heptosyltransferase [Paraburkholderia lycopersici]SDC67763.1 Glycosyltransferase family 9 (heptosyltransferase) [Paraburkholderia lycopersici]
MTPLDQVAALTHPGSLLSSEGDIVASYDVEVSGAPAEGFRPLSIVPTIRNANVCPFEVDYARLTRAHVINGLGVTLGDSIIGLTALSALRKKHPTLFFTIYRPRLVPAYVRQVYELAAPIFGCVRDLPVRVEALPDGAFQVDVGNHLFWPNFSSMPMIDFFLWALGVEPDSVPSVDKSNDWLRKVTVRDSQGKWAQQPYVLFCPVASTPVRSIPRSFRKEAVEQLWQEFHLPVLGFGDVEHDRYTDVRSLSKDTASFLAWVKNARFVLTSDTAAVHIAAGFDVPTVAFFTTIPPGLRVRDYAYCTPITLRLPELRGIQASARPGDIEIVERSYRELSGHELRRALQLQG